MDENFDIEYTTRLLIFIRAIIEDFQISEELLSIVKAPHLFRDWDVLFRIQCWMGGKKKSVNVATDGSPQTWSGKILGSSNALRR